MDLLEIKGRISVALVESIFRRAGFTLAPPVTVETSQRLGREIAGVPRGGASDASHFAETIPLTVDGLGPRGGGAHTPEEFVLESALRGRAEVALALAHEVLAKS